MPLRRSTVVGVRRVPAVTLPEPDWVATFDSDGASAIAGNDVATFTTGKYGFGQHLKLAWNELTSAVVSPATAAKYRVPGTDWIPDFRKRNGALQTMVAEVDIPGGHCTSSTDDAARIELRLSNTSRPELIPDYGDTICLGGAWYWDPDNFVFEDNPGQTLVAMQFKGSEDEGDPYVTFSNADDDDINVRVNWNGPGGASTNIWTAGLTWAQLRGHLQRWVLRIFFDETVGTVELWWALDADDLVKQTMLGGTTVWTGPTMNSIEPGSTTRIACPHYADSPYLTPGGRHRLVTTGMEAIYGTDPDNIWAVEPPTLVT
jgi:hypothetical protein